ncbi:hypothetical protein J7438_22905, partial [Thalassotalea sp. G20_0]|uniref:hypothetical protein n=1 Tax=Thalassotalea sp. G20_0 TaxID=2821093 RepID=UPI001ADA6261
SQADNLGSKSVSNPSKKITDNKASRLDRRRKYQRERRKDPAFVDRERTRGRVLILDLIVSHFHFVLRQIRCGFFNLPILDKCLLSCRN